MASVTTKIAVEGASKFKSDFREAGLAVKATSSELKFLSNELGRTGASEDALRNKSSALRSAIEAEGNAIKLLEDRLSVLAENGAENSAEAQKLTAELYKHKDAQSALQEELRETNEALDNFGSETSDASAEVNELGDKAEEAGNQIGDDFANDIAVANTVVGKLADLAVDAAKKIFEIGKDAVSYNSKMESYSKTITAFFKTSGQTAEEASKNTAELIANQKELALATGIATDNLIDANKMLIASGVNGDEAQRAISALSKSIVATGGGNEELSRMASNLQQISNTGKASAQDMKQFAMAGVDVYGLLAETTGNTVDELKEMDITFDMIVDALDSATAEGGKFFEASQVGATTLSGQMNTLQSTIQEGLGTAFQPINDILVNDLIPSAQEFVEGIDWDAVAQTVGRIGEGFADVWHAVKWFYDNYAREVEKNKEQWMDAWAEQHGFTTSVFGEFADGLDGVATHMEMTDARLEAGFSGVSIQASDVTHKLGAVTAQMPTAMQSAETSFFAPMENALSGLVSDMPTYALDAAEGFADGLGKGQGLVGGAASALANTVREYMHFSKPDKGPLRDYESWMPDFVSGLAQTMKQSEWMLADASQDLAQTITNNTVTNNISMTIHGSQGQNVNDLADVVMLKIQQATDRRSAVWA